MRWIRMCVCTYVCMFVCLFVRMSVCLYVDMYVCTYDAPDGIASQDYLGDYLGVEKRYYEPTDRGEEREVAERLTEIRRRL